MGKDKAQNEINLLTAKEVNGKIKIYRKAYAYDGDERPLKQVKSIWNHKSFFTEKGQTVFNELIGRKGKVFQSPNINNNKNTIIYAHGRNDKTMYTYEPK